jgi:hypothetical protein
MLTSGADIESYKKNPILLWMHMRPFRGTVDEVLPIGTVENIRIEGDAILGELKFDAVDDFSKEIERKWDAGTLRAVSVGATVIETSIDPSVVLPGQQYATITKWKLDEVSVVDLPANEDAIALSFKGNQNFVTLSKGNIQNFLKPIKQTKNMNSIAVKLGLTPEAAEDDVLQAIETLQSEVAKLRQGAEQATLAAIQLAVDTAIKEQRITDSQRNHFVELGKKVGINDLKLTLSAIEPAIKATEIIKRGYSSKTYDDKKWDELSEKELIELRHNNPETYIRLFMAEYGFEPELS